MNNPSAKPTPATQSGTTQADLALAGGGMAGCRWLKTFLIRTAAFTLFDVARLPIRDATNGFRLFSRRVIERSAWKIA